MRRSRRTRSSKGIWFVALVALAVPATGFTAIPNNGVINACYNSVTGHVRVVDGTQCLVGEVSLSWMQSAGVATDLVCTPPGCVHENDLSAGAVSVPKLAFDPATQAELDAHKTSTDHDARYFTKPELSSPGTLNAGGNPVHWTKLLGVPAGLADGVDADSGGDITGIATNAGSGLVGGVTSGTAPLELLSCLDGQILKRALSAWACGADVDTNAGGDMTGVMTASGSGLIGGATSGDASLSLLACSDGQILKRAATAWACGADADTDTNSGGDVTDVNTSSGSGLLGGGAGPVVNLTTDFGILQRRVTTACASNTAIVSIDAGGLAACGGGDVTGVTTAAGSGLAGGVTSGSAALSLLSCPDGQIMKRAAGAWACGTDVDTDTNSGGDITGVTTAAGTGLTGGATAGDASLSLLACTDGQILKRAASAWACGADVGSPNADTLDSLDSGQFLRSDTSDTYSSGTLTTAPGTTLNANGALSVGSDSATDDDLIGFDSFLTPETFGWVNGNTRFEAADDLAASGVVRSGCTTDAAVLYNVMGSCGAGTPAPTSGDMGNAGDLHLGGDLEVNSGVYLSKNLYMEGSNAVDADGDQNIYFYEEGSRTGRALRWDNVGESTFFGENPLFRMNDALALDASAQQGSALFTDFDGPSLEQRICFYQGFPCGEYVGWLPQSDRFSITNSLVLHGELELDLVQTATTNGVCHSGSDSDSTASDRFLVACSNSPGDVAEWYETDGVAAGEIVVATPRTVTYTSDRFDPRTGVKLDGKETLTASVLGRSMSAYQPVLGVVSTSPVQTIGKAILDVAKHPAPVAVAGRVPLKVTASNGAIKPGDAIASSGIAGAGMKATKPGAIVGHALDHFDGAGVGTILVMVDLGWYGGTEPVEDAARVTKLETENTALRSRLDDLTNRMDQLEALLSGGAASKTATVVQAAADEIEADWMPTSRIPVGW